MQGSPTHVAAAGNVAPTSAVVDVAAVTAVTGVVEALGRWDPRTAPALSVCLVLLLFLQ